MDEQNTKPESNFVNTATQKTVRLKPMVKQPVVNIGQAAKVSSVSTNSQPLSASVIEAKNAAVNTTRPNPLPATATMPVKKVSLNAKPESAVGGSVLSSLNLKPKTDSENAPQRVTIANNAEATNTAAISKVKVSNNVSEAFKDTIASSVAPTQKFVPTSNLDTSTAKVQKIDVSQINASAPEADDKTVKLQRPERKNSTVANTIVPTLAKKAAPAVQAETKAEVAAPKVEEEAVEDNTSTVAVDKVIPETPKIDIAPKAENAEAPKAAPSAAPTVKLSLNKKAPAAPVAEPKAEEKAPEAKVEAAKPKIGIKKAEPAKVEPKAEEKTTDKDADNVNLKKSNAPAAEPQVKIMKKKAPATAASPAYMVIIIIVFLLVLFGAVVSALQYLNTFEQERVMKGKVIEIPIINNFIKK
jgi:hypothetical protein